MIAIIASQYFRKHLFERRFSNVKHLIGEHWVVVNARVNCDVVYNDPYGRNKYVKINGKFMPCSDTDFLHHAWVENLENGCILNNRDGYISYLPDWYHDPMLKAIIIQQLKNENKQRQSGESEPSPAAEDSAGPEEHDDPVL